MECLKIGSGKAKAVIQRTSTKTEKEVFKIAFCSNWIV